MRQIVREFELMPGQDLPLSLPEGTREQQLNSFKRAMKLLNFDMSRTPDSLTVKVLKLITYSIHSGTTDEAINFLRRINELSYKRTT